MYLDDSIMLSFQRLKQCSEWQFATLQTVPIKTRAFITSDTLVTKEMKEVFFLALLVLPERQVASDKLSMSPGGFSPSLHGRLLAALLAAFLRLSKALCTRRSCLHTYSSVDSAPFRGKADSLLRFNLVWLFDFVKTQCKHVLAVNGLCP